MESKGRVLDLHRDYRTGKFQLVLEVDSVNKDENLKGEKRIIVKQWREKRSLDANAYSWKLYELIAVELGSTSEEIHEDMLQKYGLLDRDEQGYITITMRAEIPVSHLPGHWKYDGEHSTISWKVYRRIRGTSEYDTKEMSYFLDRVIEEAKALGIETLPPEELERIKGYERQHSRGMEKRSI